MKMGSPDKPNLIQKLFIFEHHSEPLLPRADFLRRQLKHFWIVLLIIGGSLLIGMVGYHFFEGMNWVDSFLNTSMLLGGMGPVGELRTTAGKIFAGLYALYSGIIFLVIAGILFAPIFHRMLHHFHLDEEEKQ
jgi:hypothetical protein